MHPEITIRPWPEVVAALAPLSGAEKEKLRRSLEAHGQHEAVKVLPDGRIIDGLNRWEICQENTHYVVLDISEDDAFELALDLNEARRQMSPEQVKELAKVRLAKAMERRSAGEITQEQAAFEAGVTRQAISKRERGNIATGCDVSSLDLRIKIPEAQHPVIFERFADGQTADVIAADFKVTPKRIRQVLKKEGDRQQKAAAMAKRVQEAAHLEVEGFHFGDFREVAKMIPDGSVELIFCDPPYDRKSLPLFGELAKVAAAKLCRGGSLLCYASRPILYETLALMTPHLRLWWTLAVIHTGQLDRMTELGIVVNWKPIFWFVRETRADRKIFVDDAVYSSREKCTHEWQQSLVEARYYIEKLSPKGGLIFDPFCGGGTTAVACKELGRRCITCDIDGKALAVAKGRFVKWNAENDAA
jgi:ParB-like chromosome segregation protein Spo0J